jgi:hypothetical protein
MYGRKARCIRIVVGRPEGKLGDHLGDPGVDGRIILKCMFKKWVGDMDWIELAQDRDSWWALVNAVMSLRAP